MQELINSLTLPAGVLILDDEPVWNEALQQTLRKQGVHVRSAPNLQSVLAEAGASAINTVLIDTAFLGNTENSSKELPGWHYLQEIRQRFPGKQVILYSSHYEEPSSSALKALDWEPLIIPGSPAARIEDEDKESTKSDRPSQSSPDSLAEQQAEPRPVELESGPNSDTRSSTQSLLIELTPVDLALYRAINEHPEVLKTLHWRTFEELLADILKTRGYEVELKRGTKEGGVDIIAIGHSDEFGDHRYLLQAKRWLRPVGVEPVQRLLFVGGREKATKACLATTSTFTSGALELGHEYRWQLELSDYDAIKQWVARAQSIKLGARGAQNPAPAADGWRRR